MSFGYNFFIQQYPRGEAYTPRYDLEKKFNCIYGRFNNFILNADVKNIYTEDFAEQNGAKTWIPKEEDVRFKQYDCSLILLFKKDSCQKDVRRLYNAVRGRKIEWYDTLRKRYATLICIKAPSIGDEVLYGKAPHMVVTFNFTNIDGRTYRGSQLKTEIDLDIKLTTDGESLFLHTSRPLKSEEQVVLATKGRSDVPKKCEHRPGERNYRKSSLRWHYTKYFNQSYLDGVANYKIFTAQKENDCKYVITLPDAPAKKEYATWTEYKHNKIRCRKSRNSWLLIPERIGVKGAVTYGVVVIAQRNIEYPTERISNFAYFRANVEVLSYTLRTWLST